MPSPVEELRRLLNQNKLSKSELVDLMSQVRLLLEEHNLACDFSVLNLYCNWAFHTKITRSKVCFRMLEQLTDNILKFKNQTPDKAFFFAITETVGVEKLRKDFEMVCSKFSLPCLFCTDKTIWKDFFTLLSYILADRPIKFPNHKVMHQDVKKIYDTIVAKVTAENSNLGVTEFSFEYRASKGGDNNKVLWWKAGMITPPPNGPKSICLTGQFYLEN